MFCGEREEIESLRKVVLVQCVTHCKEAHFFQPLFILRSPDLFELRCEMYSR